MIWRTLQRAPRLQPRLALLILLLAPAAFAAVDGTVLNKTTGKPQAGVTVSLLKLGSGMANIGSTKSDAKGAFHFDTLLQGEAPYMLQGLHEGVSYSKMISASAESSGLLLEVYDTSAKPVDTTVSQHMILLEPTARALGVTESIIYQNNGKTTFSNPSGTLHFYVPNGAGEISVQVRGPGGMPISRQAEKGKSPNEYTVNYAIKPGETTFNIGYSLAPTKTFESKIFHEGGATRLVVPKGVSLTGEGLTSLGAEPRTQATIYDVKGPSYKAEIEGTGSLREAAQAAASDQPASEQPDEKIEDVKPRVYSRLYWILGFITVFLVSGFAILYRTQAPAERK